MRAGIALAAAMLLVGTVQARPPGNFGYGKPPTKVEVENMVKSHFADKISNPYPLHILAIGKPTAGCFKRGAGKRDICGYRICVSQNQENALGGFMGRETAVYWKTQGYGIQVFRNQGACANDFEQWDGISEVLVPDFCVRQPDHPDCANGRKEDSRTVERVAEQTEKSEVDVGDGCTAKARSRMIERGMTAKDVAAVCAEN